MPGRNLPEPVGQHALDQARRQFGNAGTGAGGSARWGSEAEYEAAADAAIRATREMYESPKGLAAPNLKEVGVGAIRLLFNDRIDLRQAQDRVAAAWRKTHADDLPPELWAVELDRVTAGSAGQAAVRIQDQIWPALEEAGAEAWQLKTLLTFADTVDKARSVARRFVPDIERAREAAETARAAGREAEAARHLGRAEALEQQADEAVRTRKFPGGYTVEEAMAGMEKLGRDLPPETLTRLEGAANRVGAFVDDIRDLLVRSGVYDEATAAQWRTDFPHYIETRILDHLDDPTFIPPGGRISLSDSGVHRLTLEGTEQAREDPIISLMAMAFQAERRAAKNQAAGAVYRWRDVDPDLASLMRELGPGEVPDKARGETRLSWFDQGTKRDFAVSDWLAKAISFQNGWSESPVLEGVRKGSGAELLRMGATQRNPIFALGKNTLLDIPTYLIKMEAEYGPQHTLRIAQAYGEALAESFKGYNPFGESTIQGARKRFYEQGGAQAGYVNVDQTNLASWARRLERSAGYHNPAAGGTALRGARDLLATIWDVATFKWVEELGSRIEDTPRVAAMRLAEDAGAPPLRATMEGRIVTQDFRTGGELTKVLNQWVPFFNVGFQAGPWMFNLVRDHGKGGVAALTTLVVAPTIAAEAWNRADPERARANDDVPDYVKKANIVIIKPSAWLPPDQHGRERPDYWTIPVRTGMPLALMAREAAQRSMGDAPPRDWQAVLLDLVGSASPIQVDSGVSALGSFLPVAFGTALQLATGRDWFRNAALGSENADERATALPRAIDERTGLSASGVEFAARELGAGLAGIYLAAADLAAKVSGGEPVTPVNAQPADLPGVGGLVRTFAPARGGQITRDLERVRDESAAAYREQLMGQLNATDLNKGERDQLERHVRTWATRAANWAVFGAPADPGPQIRRAEQEAERHGMPPELRAEHLAALRAAAYGESQTGRGEREQAMGAAVATPGTSRFGTPAEGYWRDQSQPWKYRGVDDVAEERRIDRAIQEVNDYEALQRARYRGEVPRDTTIAAPPVDLRNLHYRYGKESARTPEYRRWAKENGIEDLVERVEERQVEQRVRRRAS